MKSLIIATSLVLLLSGCVTMDRVQKRMDGKLLNVAEASKNLAKEEATPEEEAKIGRESASMLLGASPLIQNKELLRYINQIGGWIAQQTERPEVNWRFGILDTNNVNAFAAPDGYVFVTRGLLLRLNDEAELAGILAHEIAHVIKRHYVIAMKKRDEMGAIGNLFSATVQVVGVPGSAVTPVFNLAQNMYSAGLDKSDEYEADRLGILYATRAGYDPYGLARVLSMYAANADGQGFELLFSTHPSPQDRLAAMETFMGKKLAAFETTGVSNAPQFKKLQALASNKNLAKK